MILSVMAMILLPLAMAGVLLWAPARPLIVRSLAFAPAPALLFLPSAWDGSISAVSLAGGWTFVVDQAGALMLAASTLLWMIGGFAATHWLAGRPDQPRFAIWWLLTLAGSLGVFVAGDVVSFYALYALASLPAYGLVVFEGGEGARRAGRVTLAAALVGEGIILAAFVLLAIAGAGQGLSIAVLLHALPASPLCGLVIALVVIGFGLKIGLVPLHGWMPMSYAAGPLAATAVLSGATSKAGIIGLLRFLPLDVAMPEAGGVILAAGLVSAFYGAFMGLTQDNPRSVLAYSSISQLGQMAAVLGAGLSGGIPGAATMVAFSAAYHVLTKGGLFLMLGARQDGEALAGWRLALAAFMAFGFAGLPLTGGALAKLAFKDIVGTGFAGLLFSFAAVGSTVLMLHFLRLLKTGGQPRMARVLPAGAWIVTALLGTLLPWILFASVTGMEASYALKPFVLIELLWPVALGLFLGWVLVATGTRLPSQDLGDIGATTIDGLGHGAEHVAALAERFEARARQWPLSSLVLIGAFATFFLLQLAFSGR